MEMRKRKMIREKERKREMIKEIKRGQYK